ncbi:MAG TPA: hypothetical protein VFY23_04460 [Candidatus Limnocylindrales bacterium]|nr:hypothetical protein [Candidatus Limnocylindrales bacterium]
MKVDRSIAEGPAGARREDQAASSLTTLVVGLLIALGALVVYAASNPEHFNAYNHFVWQADAFLDGRAWIPFPEPATATTPSNTYLQDTYPLFEDGAFTGRVLLPFPPLPALVLLPFVAVFGLSLDQESVALGIAAVGVFCAWWMLGGLRITMGVRALTTIVFATGTVWWWAAAVGSTWYLAHLVAVVLSLLAVGVALRADRRAPDEDPVAEAVRAPGSMRSRLWPLDRSQLLAGLLLGIAATARLPLVFAAPFLMFVGGGESTVRRTLSAAVGAVLPVAALLGYTWLTTGSLLHPGYDYQYQLEANGYQTLGYNPEWAVEDLRYIPQNLGIMFGALPEIAPDVRPDTLGVYPTEYLCTAPDATRGLFDPDCPIALPVDIGTSILLSAPGLLLALFAVARRPLARLTLGAGLTVLVVGLFNLAHFSQGWVQWGYRFSLDFIPFLLPLVALGAARAGDGKPRLTALVLVVAGAAINLWGVAWGQLLGW